MPTDPFVDGTGSLRRRNALLAAGFSCEQIAEAAGLARRTVKCWSSRTGRTRASADRRMRRAFDTLYVLPQPQGVYADARRTTAARLGYVPADEWADIDDPTDRPDRYYRRVRQQAATPAPNRVAEAVVVAIRDEYRAADVGEFRPADVAARHGVSKPTVSRILHGAVGGETTDLIVELGRKFAAPKRPTPARNRITTARIHAVRADYLAGLGYRRLAARHDVSETLAGRIVHGRIRPELGLTDLTAHTRGDHTAAPPTGGNDRKETPAA